LKAIATRLVERSAGRRHFGERMNRQRLDVFRSGPIYLIARGSVARRGVCRIVSPSEGISERILLGRALKHVTVAEPWRRIYHHQRSSLPDLVKRAIETF
jgi:hypothetical protein